MSEQVRDWLPVGALDALPVRRAIGEAVDSWSERWFAGARLAAADFAARRPGAALASPTWRRYGTATALAATGAELFRLAGLALGTRPEGLVLSEVDRDIIGRFTARIAADLAATIEQAIDRAAPADDAETFVEMPLPDGGLSFAVVDGTGAAIVEGAVPLAALVAFRKSGLRSSRRARPALTRRNRAIGATRVRIEARLGTAALPLGDLAGLAPGDVLILDRAIAQGADLALNRSGRPFARAQIVDRGADLSLILSPQPKD